MAIKILSLLCILLSFSAHAEAIKIEAYNFSVSDVRDGGHTKEELFQKMDRNLLVRSKDSICSNRAHIWAYELKKKHIESLKVFMFFTAKTSYFEGSSWWYHVAPAINEDNDIWVLDGGFPNRIKKPLLVQEWLKEFNGKSSVCKEIQNEEEFLVKLMLGSEAFPETTPAGSFNCYYRITPPGYWIPSQIARHLSGELDREDFEEGEVFQACRKTSTSTIGYALRRNASLCAEFLKI